MWYSSQWRASIPLMTDSYCEASTHFQYKRIKKLRLAPWASSECHPKLELLQKNSSRPFSKSHIFQMLTPIHWKSMWFILIAQCVLQALPTSSSPRISMSHQRLQQPTLRFSFWLIVGLVLPTKISLKVVLSEIGHHFLWQPYRTN